MATKIVNLTPDTVYVLSKDGETILEYPPSGTVAYVEEIPTDEIGHRLPFVARNPSSYRVYNLPDADYLSDDVIAYIVTPEVANAARRLDRDDVFHLGLPAETTSASGHKGAVAFLKCAVGHMRIIRKPVPEDEEE